MAHKFSTIEYQEKVSQVHGDTLIINSAYANTDSKVELQCKNCDHNWTDKPAEVLKGKGCPKCKCNRKRLSIKTYQELIDQKFGSNKIKVITYKGVEKTSSFFCIKCDKQWSANSLAVLNSSIPCRFCSTTALKKFQQKLKEKFCNTITLLDKSIKRKSLSFKCVECNHKFASTKVKILKKTIGCIHCESKVLSRVKSLPKETLNIIRLYKSKLSLTQLAAISGLNKPTLLYLLNSEDNYILPTINTLPTYTIPDNYSNGLVVLGMDPGMRNFGIFIGKLYGTDQLEKIEIYRSDLLNTPVSSLKESDIGQHIEGFNIEITALFAKYKPDAIFMERFMGRGFSGNGAISEITNIMVGMLLCHSTTYYDNVILPIIRCITPASWKAQVNAIYKLDYLYKDAKVVGIEPHRIDAFLMAISQFPSPNKYSNFEFLGNHKLRTKVLTALIDSQVAQQSCLINLR